MNPKKEKQEDWQEFISKVVKNRASGTKYLLIPKLWADVHNIKEKAKYNVKIKKVK